MKTYLKLLKALDLIHAQKIKLLTKKEILYTDLHKIYSKIEEVYSIMSNKKHTPEFYEVNAKFKEVNKIETKGGQ